MLMSECGLHSTEIGQHAATGYCEYSNEISDCIKVGITDHLTSYECLKNDCPLDAFGQIIYL